METFARRPFPAQIMHVSMMVLGIAAAMTIVIILMKAFTSPWLALTQNEDYGVSDRC